MRQDDSTVRKAGASVIQADRQLAEFIVSQTRGYGVKLPNDDDSRVQAAARHRLSAAHTADGTIGSGFTLYAQSRAEVFEQCARVADRYRGEAGGSASYKQACEHIVANLRALESSPADGAGGAIPEGMVLVPREPTEAMKYAGVPVFERALSNGKHDAANAETVWKAMIASAIRALTPTETGEQGKALGGAEG